MISLFRSALLLACVSLTALALRANEAQVIVNCVSVRLHPASLDELGLECTLEATTAMNNTINDEIGLSDGGDYLYATTLVLSGGLFSGPLWISCGLEVPDPPDSNWNAISDFFEVDRAVNNIPSVGDFTLEDGTSVYPGTLDMIWNRDAGAAVGSCQLRLRIPDFGLDMTFRHQFEIYDYRGTLSYTVKGTDVLGTLDLTRAGAAGSLHGSWPLTRLSANELAFPGFPWTNELGQFLQFWGSANTEISLVRGLMHGTNYYTTLITDDGWPATATAEEYQIWQAFLFDANDRDHDGIPDLSDSPAPSAPQLGIRQGDKSVLLDLAATVGLVATIEQSPQVAPTQWTALTTFTVTNALQTLTLPTPASPTYWRARVE